MCIHRFIALLLTVSLVPACDDVEPESSVPEAEQLEFLSGVSCIGGQDGGVINTGGLNGLVTSGFDTTGQEHNGVIVTDVFVRSDGTEGSETPLVAYYAEGGILYGEDAFGNTYAAGDFVDSTWNLLVDVELFDDPPAPKGQVEWVMTVQAFIEDGSRSRYVFTNGPTADSQEAFSCDMDLETGEFTAILYDDLYVNAEGTHIERPNTIYLGCISGAVGKAGMWGYPQHEVGLEMHQAATRMVRADYCGTGVSYTQTGTHLQVKDSLSINTFPDPGKSTEAMWTANGAACLMETRRTEVGYEAVECNGQLLPMCGAGDDLSDWNALFWTKTMPQPTMP